MTRVADSDRDVYGDWALHVVNATRHALRSENLMSSWEARTIRIVHRLLLSLDPAAANIRQANVAIRPDPKKKGTS